MVSPLVFQMVAQKKSKKQNSKSARTVKISVQALGGRDHKILHLVKTECTFMASHGRSVATATATVWDTIWDTTPRNLGYHFGIPPLDFLDTIWDATPIFMDTILGYHVGYHPLKFCDTIECIVIPEQNLFNIEYDGSTYGMTAGPYSNTKSIHMKLLF